MPLAEFYRSLADIIVTRKVPGRAMIVGINGVDGSGKTVLAANLSKVLEEAGHPVCHLSVDGFHHPKSHRYRRGEQSPEAYYLDSIDYQAFADALRPVFDARAFPVKCARQTFDLAQDKADAIYQDVDGNAIVIAEGVFIFRPEIRPLIHVAIYVDAGFDTILERVKARDVATLGSPERVEARYRRKYIPGQQRYLAEVNPARLADVVVDNNDFTCPKIVR